MAAFALLFVAFAAAPDDLVLVQFSSAACGACRTMAPVVARLESAGVRVQHVDAQQDAALAQQYRVRVLPTFVVLARGQEVQRVEGAVPLEQLAAALQAAAAGPGLASDSGRAGAAGAKNAAPELLVRGQDSGASFPPANAAVPSAPPQQLPASLTPFAAARQYAAPAAVQPLAAFPGAASAGPGAHEAVRQVMARALQATVRLKVEDGQGLGFGTGTVVDRHGDEALVLTCGHLFRDWKKDGQIAADLHDAEGRPTATAPGQLIAFNLDHDVALVAIRLASGAQTMPVAPAGFVLRPGDRVFSIGCDKGGQPSVRASHVNAVNRFQGEPNVTVAGQPCDGRSGGGLFTEDGYVVGVCNAANAKDDEGLYAALPSIHWQLDSIGQAAIYQRSAPSAGSVAAAPAAPAPAALQAPRPFPQPAAAAPSPATPASFLVAPAPQPQPAAPLRGPMAGGGVSAANGLGSDTEVLVIVRSKSNPQAGSQVFMVDQLPAEWLQQLAGLARPVSPEVVSVPRQPGHPAGPSVVRGQSQ